MLRYTYVVYLVIKLLTLDRVAEEFCAAIKVEFAVIERPLLRQTSRKEKPKRMTVGVRYKKVPLAESVHIKKVRSYHTVVAEGFQVLNLYAKEGNKIHSGRTYLTLLWYHGSMRPQYFLTHFFFKLSGILTSPFTYFFVWPS
jgi:hypothetical protein